MAAILNSLGIGSRTAPGALPAPREGSTHQKRPRNGSGPGSDSEEDRPSFDPSEIKKLVSDALLAALPSIIGDLVPRLMAAMSPEIERLVQFEIAKATDAYSVHFTEIDKKLQDLQTSSQVTCRLNSRLQVLENKLEVTQERADAQDQAFRGPNMFINGLAEGAEGADLRGHLSGLFTEVPLGGLLEARRVGRPQQGATRPRSVFARFVDTDTKHKALKSSKVLRMRRVYLDMDLTPLQQELRIARKGLYLNLQQQGARPFWRGARIFYTHNGQRMEAGKGPSPGRAHAPPPGHSPPRGAPAPAPVPSASTVPPPQVPAGDPPTASIPTASSPPTQG